MVEGFRSRQNDMKNLPWKDQQDQFLQCLDPNLASEIEKLIRSERGNLEGILIIAAGNDLDCLKTLEKWYKKRYPIVARQKELLTLKQPTHMHPSTWMNEVDDKFIAAGFLEDPNEVMPVSLLKKIILINGFNWSQKMETAIQKYEDPTLEELREVMNNVDDWETKLSSFKKSDKSANFVKDKKGKKNRDNSNNRGRSSSAKRGKNSRDRSKSQEGRSNSNNNNNRERCKHCNRPKVYCKNFASCSQRELLQKVQQKELLRKCLSRLQEEETFGEIVFSCCGAF